MSNTNFGLQNVFSAPLQISLKTQISAKIIDIILNNKFNNQISE